MPNPPIYDCIVIGAGPAGLSAALFLARYRHHVLVFHHNDPRNLYSYGVHGFLGQHGIPPVDLLARGRDEVTQHGGVILEGLATNAERVTDEHFRVTVGLVEDASISQTFNARRLLLATGLRDVKPDLPGFSEFYGLSVFHCSDCDGYEANGKSVVVLSHGKTAIGFTLGLLTWTDRLTLITSGDINEITSEYRAKLASFNIPILHKDILKLEGDADAGLLERVVLADGDTLECDALFFNLGTFPASNLHETLGCTLDEETGLIWIDKQQQTSVRGVYAAGDITPGSQLAVVAASEGAMAAIHIHKSLVPDDRRV